MQLAAYVQSAVANEWVDRMTLVMPLFHVYGNMGMNTALLAHWPMVSVPNPRDLDDLVSTLGKVNPAVLHGVPTLYTALLDHPGVRLGQANFTSLKICFAGAAPLMVVMNKRLEALTGGSLLGGYGMSESILAAIVCPAHGKYKEGSTGFPLPDVVVSIGDQATGRETLPLGEIGSSP